MSVFNAICGPLLFQYTTAASLPSTDNETLSGNIGKYKNSGGGCTAYTVAVLLIVVNSSEDSESL